MSTIMNHISQNKKSVLFSILLLSAAAILVKIKPAGLLTGDTLNKAIQIQAVIDNNFRSAALSCDTSKPLQSCEFLPPEFRLYGDAVHGPFPVFLSYLAAPFVKFFGLTVIPWLSLLIFFLSIYLLNKKWELHWSILAFSFLATPWYIHALGFIDVSISNLFVVLVMSLLTVDKNRVNPWLYAPYAAAFWLRPETAILLALIIALVFFHNRPSDLRPVYYSSLWFLGGLTLYFLINFHTSGSILGPRILYNQSEIGMFSLQKISNLVSLLFYGDMRFGYFGFVPLFGLLYFIVVKRYTDLPVTYKILGISSILYIVTAAVLSPNNSNIDWGTRYFSITLPVNIVIINFLLKNFYLNSSGKALRLAAALLFAYSLSINLMAVKIYKNSSRQIKSVQDFFNKQDTPVWVFSDVITFGHIGIEYFGKRALFIKDENEMKKVMAALTEQKRPFSYFHPLQVPSSLPDSDKVEISDYTPVFSKKFKKTGSDHFMIFRAENFTP